MPTVQKAAPTTPTPLGEPDIKISVRQTFGIDSDLEVPAFSQPSEHVPDMDEAYRFDHDTTLAILAGFAFNRRVMIPRLSRHRQIDACRAGRLAAQLAADPRQSRQPHQPHRSRRQGRDRAARRQAGHRVPRGHPAVGVAAPGRAVLRRIRRRPARRDVRDPARARGRRQIDAARPEPGHPAACRVPPVLDREYGRARRHQRPLPRDAADQPGPDGPLEHRRDAQLPAARCRGRDRPRQGADYNNDDGRRRSAPWWRWPT